MEQIVRAKNASSGKVLFQAALQFEGGLGRHERTQHRVGFGSELVETLGRRLTLKERCIRQVGEQLLDLICRERFGRLQPFKRLG
jgi:hypothetical protein